MNPEDLTLRCRHCGSANRIPVERALKDLTAVTCGRCKGGLLRVAGEPLPEITDGDLTHPFDRDALEKLRAVPFVDKIVSKVMSGTVDKLASFYMLSIGSGGDWLSSTMLRIFSSCKSEFYLWFEDCRGTSREIM